MTAESDNNPGAHRDAATAIARQRAASPENDFAVHDFAKPPLSIQPFFKNFFQFCSFCPIPASPRQS
jgi:hypothetical protein